MRLNGKYVGYRSGRSLIKEGSAAMYSRPMDGFGIPKSLADHYLIDGKSIVRHRKVWARGKSVICDAMIDTVEIYWKDSLYQTALVNFVKYGTLMDMPYGEPRYILPRNKFLCISRKELELGYE